MTEMRFRNEAAFTDAVIDLAKMNGWLVHHDRMKQNVQGHAGFVDLVLAREGEVLFWELKMPASKKTELQNLWQQHLHSTVVRPSDWDRVVARLRR